MWLCLTGKWLMARIQRLDRCLVVSTKVLMWKLPLANLYLLSFRKAKGAQFCDSYAAKEAVLWSKLAVIPRVE